jgi:hypothetical protein
LWINQEENMRPLAMLLLLLMHGLCTAQSESLSACLEKLGADPAFALLANKVSLGAAATATPAMLADPSIANSKERPVISAWASTRADCLKTESKFGNEVYRPPLQAAGIDAEHKLMAAAVELYDQKISYAEFNRRRLAIADEMREKAAQVSRQIQQQGMAFEQADRQAREREQMQREIDEASRQASIARQQAEAAQQAAARRSVRPNASPGARPYQPPPVVTARNCFRFGNRIACTGW